MVFFQLLITAAEGPVFILTLTKCLSPLTGSSAMNKLRQSFRRKKDIYVPESSRPHQWQTDEEAVRNGKCSFAVKVTLPTLPPTKASLDNISQMHNECWADLNNVTPLRNRVLLMINYNHSEWEHSFYLAWNMVCCSRRCVCSAQLISGLWCYQMLLNHCSVKDKVTQLRIFAHVLFSEKLNWQS